MRLRAMFDAAVMAIALVPIKAIDNGLGLTPPMGWRSWLPFKHNQSQQKMMAAANAMVSRKRGASLLELGYLFSKII